MSTPSFGRQPGTTRFQSARRGGFTLIEVAIALAIFVFGALAIVQIFPPALGVIRNNESRITATQMGENTLAQFKNKTSPPPEAIFDVDATITDTANPYKWNDYVGAVVGTSNKNNSLPRSAPAFNASALGHFRYIYGEPHRISGGQTISLNYPQDTRTPALATLQFFVDEVVEGVQIKENGSLDFANAYLASDPSQPFRGTAPADTDPTSRRPPDTARRDDNVTYYVSYRWREYIAPGSPPTYSAIKGVLEEPISIPDDAGSATYSTSTSGRVLPCIGSNNKAIPGGVTVKIRRTYTAVPNGTPSDLGPPDKTINLITYTGTNPITFYVNYYASDWRNLSDWDAPVNNTVQLPVTGIDTTSVIGIRTNANQTVVPTLLSPDVSSPEKLKAAEKGVIEFSSSSGSGARVRTIYRTIDEWTSQPSVAPRSYIPFNALRLTNADFPHQPWREYVWLPGDPSNIYFHASEAGKTAVIDYSYGTTNIPTKTTLTIGNIQDAPSALPSGFAPSGKVARATLILPNGNAATTANAILSVQGLSVQARTAWQNADKYNQVIVPGYRNLMQ